MGQRGSRVWAASVGSGTGGDWMAVRESARYWVCRFNGLDNLSTVSLSLSDSVSVR